PRAARFLPSPPKSTSAALPSAPPISAPIGPNSDPAAPPMADPQLDSASFPNSASPTLPPRYLPAYPAMADRPMSMADISPTRIPISARKGESPPTLLIQSPRPARGLDCNSLV